MSQEQDKTVIKDFDPLNKFIDAYFNESNIDLNTPIHKSRSKINKKENIDDYSMAKQEKMLEHEADRYVNNTRQRRFLVSRTIWIIVGWLLGVLVLLYLCGSKLFWLDKTVLCTLLATTTVNVLGLGHIIIRGLFFVPEKTKE